MRKTKIAAMFMATALMTNVVGTTAFAAEEWNTQGGEATAEGTAFITQPTLEVAIPADLTFGINPLGIGEGDDAKQIVSTDYPVINYSNTPVVINSKTKVVTLGTNVELASSPTVDEKSGDLVAATSKKNAYLYVMAPKTVEISNETESGFKFTYAADVAADTSSHTITATELKASNAKALTTNVVEFNFGLAKASDTPTVTQAAAFKFGGLVDPQATFEDGDITVQTVYTLNAVTDSQLTKSYEADTEALKDAAPQIVKAK